MMSASALVVALGATAVVLTNDDRPGRLETVASDPSAPLETEPSVSPSAPTSVEPTTDQEGMNILVVGTDNGACLDPDSPYAPAFGDRSSMGDRSDTIMIVRLDPAQGRASILSLPRDLWVPIAGRDAPGRINSAFVRDDPMRLIETIGQNFSIGIDHFVQIDFCGFTSIVDAVGGVAVPFDHPVRDEHTGLDVPEPGCRTLNGDQALAYVRARHYQSLIDGVWVSDGSSDLGRIARQQDFIQRTMTAVLNRGLDAGLVRAMISAVQEDLVVDTGLTPGRMLEIAGQLQAVSGNIGHFQIEVEPKVIAANSVLVPITDSPTMQSIIHLFQGRPDAASTAATPATGPADNLEGQPASAAPCP
jgi:LCP family protein required for cell wall assembly